MALVALDLGEPPAAEWIRRLRQDAARSAGIGYVLVVATHTHSGPEIRHEYPPTEGPDWESGVLDTVGRAIDEACGRVVEARTGTGYGGVLIGHNRLRLAPDGTITWFERNNTMVPTAPVDPGGQPLAMFLQGGDGDINPYTPPWPPSSTTGRSP